MAIVRDNGEIIIRKQEQNKTKLKQFKNMADLISQITSYDEGKGRYEFEPTNCDLSGLDFSNVNFEGQNDKFNGERKPIRFDGSDLSNCSFHQAEELYICSFANVNIDNADFSDTYWEDNHLNGLKGTNVNFENCEFNEANLNDTEFSNCNFKNATFWKVQMNRSKFTDCNLAISNGGGHCGLRNADISGSSINENFSNFAYLPNLKTDNIKGSSQAIEALYALREEHDSDYAEEKAKNEKMLNDPETQAILARWRAMGLKIEL